MALNAIFRLIKARGRMHIFDRNIIKRNWKSINESPLKHAGLLARKIERQLIRIDTSKSQRPSKPGRPPKSRAPGHPFRRIYSDVNLWQTNVIVGHVGFGAKQTAMEIQEFGQTVTIKEKRIPRLRKQIKNLALRRLIAAKFRRGELKSTPIPIVTRRIHMPERPFALPTTRLVARRLPPLWANSVSPATVRN